MILYNKLLLFTQHHIYLTIDVALHPGYYSSITTKITLICKNYFFLCTISITTLNTYTRNTKYFLFTAASNDIDTIRGNLRSVIKSFVAFLNTVQGLMQNVAGLGGGFLGGAVKPSISALANFTKYVSDLLSYTGQ